MDKKISLSTLLLVLALIIIGIMGYMMYNMNIQNNELGKQIEELANKDEEKVEIQEDTFTTYKENYQKAFKEIMIGKSTISIWPDYEMPGVEEVYLDSNNDAYLRFKEGSELYKKYGQSYKVETGVANIFLCHNGTGGYADAVFLKLDGTASYVNGCELEETNTIKCKKEEGIKNAVNVISYTADYSEIIGGEEVQFAAPEYVFIDVNGNIIK